MVSQRDAPENEKLLLKMPVLGLGRWNRLKAV